MGRRSRKRGVGGPTSTARAAGARTPAPARARAATRAPSRRAKLDEAPKPPWAPFPLTEIAILIALVLLVLGFLGGEPEPRFLLTGFVLVTLAAGELAVREHFAGYRSHTLLLSGICAVVAVVPLALAGLPQIAVVAVAIAVFAGAVGLLRSAFARRSGGLGFRA